MTDEQASPSLADLTAHYRQAQSALEDAREALADGIRTQYDAGMRQADIVRAIDHVWTVEYVRKIIKGIVRPGSSAKG